MSAIAKLLTTDAPKLFDTLFDLPWYKDIHEAWLLNLLQQKTAARVLELGCGPGRLLRSVADGGHTVVGLDQSAKMLKKATQNLRLFPGITLLQGSAESIPYDDNVFDFAVAASLINVVDDSVAVLREMVRVVALDGVVSFLVPSENMNSRLVTQYVRENNLQDMSSNALQLWAKLARKMSAKQCEQVSTAAGLVNVEVVPRLSGMVNTVTGTKPD
ncbi:MAG: class I SAM-dependent methyltransferase [Exilibacterium sp.]